MVAGNKSIVDRCQPVLEAVGKHITYVGAEVGMGQAAKACLQTLVGCIYSSIFESLVLGSAPKRGMPSWGQASQIRGYCKSLS